jgi:hypothetical protein
LLDLFSENTYPAKYAAAKATFTCIMCEKKANTFSNISAHFEYNISGLCQDCQCEYLGGSSPSPQNKPM